MKSVLSKLLVVFCLMLTHTTFAQSVTVLQINAEWNEMNTRRDLSRLTGCSYQFGYLEQQPKSVSDNIKSVPTIIIFVDNRPKKIYSAGINLKLEMPLSEIQSEIDRLRD